MEIRKFLKNKKGQWAHEYSRMVRGVERTTRVYKTKILLSEGWSIPKIATSLRVGTNTVKVYAKECEHISLSEAKGHFTKICQKCNYPNYMFYEQYDKCKKCGADLYLKVCFIATASFGTPLAKEINILRQWRDNSLIKNNFGRKFIKFYYLISPPIATIIKKSEAIKIITRFFIRIFIKFLKLK